MMLALSGILPRLAGYVDTSAPPTMVQLERMKVLLYSTDIAGISLALLLLWFYPLTRHRCAEIRRQLNERSLA